MNVGDSVEIDDISLILILLGVITVVALFTCYGIAVYSLSALILQLFKNELKSVLEYVFEKCFRATE